VPDAARAERPNARARARVVGVYDFSVIFLSMIGLGVNDGVSRRSNARIERSRARIGGSTAPASRSSSARARGDFEWGGFRACASPQCRALVLR